MRVFSCNYQNWIFDRLVSLRPLPFTSTTMVPRFPTQKRPSPVKQYYLILYNTLSCLGWGYILVMTYFHLTDIPLPDILGFNSGGASASLYQALVEYVRELVEELIEEAKRLIIPSNNLFIIPSQLLDVYNRMITTYDVVGGTVAIVQTAAALEVVHAVTGLVKSPIPTAVVQVYSRLFLVWGVTEKYEQSRHNPLYSTMILAWSMTEVIRYAFYTLSLARDTVPGVLVYLRYTTFYVLYPLGASSEALLILSSLPTTNILEGHKDGSWNTWDYFRGVMFIAWWPGLVVMMAHMVVQRRKVYMRSPGFIKFKSS